MGYIKHNAIVVTVYGQERADAAVAEGNRLGCCVIGPSREVTNGYHTLLICPDGSKEGWNESDDGNDRRDAFVEWLAGKSAEWVEVEYGYDDSDANIVRSAFDGKESPNV